MSDKNIDVIKQIKTTGQAPSAGMTSIESINKFKNKSMKVSYLPSIRTEIAALQYVLDNIPAGSQIQYPFIMQQLLLLISMLVNEIDPKGNLIEV